MFKMKTKNIVFHIFLLLLLRLVKASAFVQDYHTIHDCRLPTNCLAVNEFQPLVLQSVLQYPSYEQSFQFQYPISVNSDAFVRVTEETRLVCAHGNLRINSRSLPEDVRSVSIQCGVTSYQLTQADYPPVHGHYYRYKSKPRCVTSANTFAEIGCTARQFPEAFLVHDRSKHCQSKICNTWVEIGYQLNDRFLPTIEFIIVNETKLQPLMAHVTIPPVIGSRQIGRYTWMMRKGPIFGAIPVRIEEVYRRDYQRGRFYEIFRNRQLVDFYIPEYGDTYLTEGQLISEHDFFYKSQISSASFYENTVPIWRIIARGNWALAGEFVRQLAAKTRRGLQLWSGTIGQLAFPDFYRDERPIFLMEGVNGEHLVPVPQLLYKYVVDYDGYYGPRGLMLITVNDPRGSHYLDYARHHICPPRQTCQRIHPEFADTRLGYTYCCALEDVWPTAEQLGLPVFSGGIEMLL
ncbi:uncharacterized protein LOC107982029 isoform X1 [Nasonia vitripennis]|uniref:DNA/RNA non-specific endonuclease/pyrophosphatase/phosphodiesterase domain-containing protein n=1 Tax=Nasonia vitripennis TaxID=7425 RepID=A0A7M7IUF3_NASVI|nr:uncharacterized protein LOC107982029 isoform X1 [Nasonia vitripennis]